MEIAVYAPYAFGISDWAVENRVKAAGCQGHQEGAWQLVPSTVCMDPQPMAKQAKAPHQHTLNGAVMQENGRLNR